MSALLEIKGLSAGYGRIPVLHGVECNVHDNEILGILGNNGMGKSTLLKTVMGIISPTSGTILYSGQDVTRLKPGPRAQYGMGYVPQGTRDISQSKRFGQSAHGCCGSWIR